MTMFNFKRVLDATTGKFYFFDNAALVDEELDTSPNGANMYRVDLAPMDNADREIIGILLRVGNNGGYAQITRNLDPDAAEIQTGKGRSTHYLMDCIIEKDLLIIAEE